MNGIPTVLIEERLIFTQEIADLLDGKEKTVAIPIPGLDTEIFGGFMKVFQDRRTDLLHWVQSLQLLYNDRIRGGNRKMSPRCREVLKKLLSIRSGRNFSAVKLLEIKRIAREKGRLHIVWVLFRDLPIEI